MRINFTVRGILIDGDGCSLTLLTEMLQVPFSMPVQRDIAESLRIGDRVVLTTTMEDLMPRSGDSRKMKQGGYEVFDGHKWNEYVAGTAIKNSSNSNDQ